jgi:hypothetical protein
MGEIRDSYLVFLLRLLCLVAAITQDEAFSTFNYSPHYGRADCTHIHRLHNGLDGLRASRRRRQDTQGLHRLAAIVTPGFPECTADRDESFLGLRKSP